MAKRVRSTKKLLAYKVVRKIGDHYSHTMRGVDRHWLKGIKIRREPGDYPFCLSPTKEFAASYFLCMHENKHWRADEMRIVKVSYEPSSEPHPDDHVGYPGQEECGGTVLANSFTILEEIGFTFEPVCY